MRLCSPEHDNRKPRCCSRILASGAERHRRRTRSIRLEENTYNQQQSENFLLHLAKDSFVTMGLCTLKCRCAVQVEISNDGVEYATRPLIVFYISMPVARVPLRDIRPRKLQNLSTNICLRLLREARRDPRHLEQGSKHSMTRRSSHLSWSARGWRTYTDEGHTTAERA